MAEFERIENLIEFLLDSLNDNKIELGINFVGGYDEKLVTDYPAVIFGSGNTTKEVAGTHQFLIQHNLDIYIQHAEASESHRQRSLEMLKTVTKLTAFLEADKTMGERLIFGYVVTERPGLVQPRAKPSVFIVSTIISYQATLKAAFA